MFVFCCFFFVVVVHSFCIFPHCDHECITFVGLNKHSLQDEEAGKRRIEDKSLAPLKYVGMLPLTSVGSGF